MTSTISASRAIGASLVLVLVSGCAATPPPQPSTPPPAPPPSAAPASDDTELPPSLRDLDLTPAQRDEILRIRTDFMTKAEPFAEAADELGRSVAGAARQCKGESPFVDADAERLVRMGEELRGDLLDSIQKFHRLLTPAQRKKLSQRLLEGDQWAKRERRNESRTRELGPALDLSTMQLVSMLMKARVLWSTYADKAEPWRLHYEAAVTSFARDDFDVRREPIAKVPAVALSTEFLRMGMHFLIPILEPSQCEALGRLIDDKVAEATARRGKPGAKGPSGEGH